MNRSKLVWILIPVISVLAFAHFNRSHLQKDLEARCEARFKDFVFDGRKKDYAISFVSSSNMDWTRLFQENKSSPGGGLKQTAILSLKANWEMTTVQKDNKTVIVNQLKSPLISLQFNGNSNPQQNHQIALELSQPFFIFVDASGAIQEIQTQKPLSTIAQNLLRWLSSDSHLVLNQNHKKQWTSTESDPNGRYEAKYEITAEDSKGVQVTKQKQRYLELALAKERNNSRADQFQIPISIVPVGMTTAQFDCDRKSLTHLLVDSQTQTKMGTIFIGKGESHLEMNLKSVSEGSSDLLTQLLEKSEASESSKMGVMAVENPQEIEKLIQRNELGTLTTQDLLAKLKEAKASQNPEDISELYLKFKALAYLHPESCRVLAEELIKEDTKNPKAMQMIATALSAAGTPEAQNALVTALNARKDEVPATQILIPALGMTDHPTPEAESALRQLISTSTVEDIISTAGLSLGAMAGHLAETDPARQRLIVEQVQRDLENAQEGPQKRLLLSMLGNAGSVESLSAVAKSLESSDVDEQAEAAMALRFIPGQEAESKLTGLLSQDVDPSVKEAAVVALGYRSPGESTCQSLRSSFNVQTSETVRREILKNIFECRNLMTGVKEWMSVVRQSDSSENVRKLAGDYSEMMKDTN